MIAKILTSAAKLAGLLYLLTWERVVGLPLLFVLLGLIWLDKNQENDLKHLVLTAFLSLLLAAVYQLGWIASLLLFIGSELLAIHSEQLIQAKNKRLLLASALFNFVLWAAAGIEFTHLILAQLVLSYVLVLLWLRMVSIRTKKSSQLDVKLWKDSDFNW